MLQPRPNQTPRRVDNPSVWSVLVVSDRKAKKLDIPKPDGITFSEFRCILDAHTQRSRFALAGQAWPEKNDAELLRKLASFRSPRWELETDPLLWLSRVRWNIWQAALSSADLQPPEKSNRESTLPAWPAPASNSYSALVAWAYRHRPSNSRLDAVCSFLFDGVSGRPEPAVQDNATGHWLLWIGQARGWSRLDTVQRCLATGVYQFRRPDLSTRSLDEADDV